MLYVFDVFLEVWPNNNINILQSRHNDHLLIQHSNHHFYEFLVRIWLFDIGQNSKVKENILVNDFSSS